jgi:hypothetical protein
LLRLRVLLAAFVALLVLAPAAAAHIVVASPNGNGNGTTQWVGGGPVPANGAGLVWSPVGMLPPAHVHGLVHACMVTMGNPAAAVFLAPPYFTGCHHGMP